VRFVCNWRYTEVRARGGHDKLRGVKPTHSLGVIGSITVTVKAQ